MERLLKVPNYFPVTQTHTRVEENGDDEFKELTLEEMRRSAHQADMLEEAEQNDPARQRYQRMYWEALPEFGGVGFCFSFHL